MSFSFAHLFQQYELSDVELVLRVAEGAPIGADAAGAAAAAAPADAGESCPAVLLRRLPAHKVILSLSPFLKAQMQRWQHARSLDTCQAFPDAAGPALSSGGGSSACSSPPSGGGDSCPEVTLTLQTRDEEPAAMAILAALYGVKTIPATLDDLSDTQRLQVAILADMLQVPDMARLAVDRLAATARCEAGLPADTLRHFLALPALPGCLLPLLGSALAACLRAPAGEFAPDAIQRTLLGVLGDLEAVYADKGLRRLLLQLPLPVMELLLSMNELQVASEDTVLFTAQTYSKHLASLAQRQAAQAQLAPLVRCPHLSPFWLSALALYDAPDAALLAPLRHQVRQLVAMLQAAPGGAQQQQPQQLLAAEDVARLLPGAPPSWCRPPRRIGPPVAGVSLRWKVALADVRAACKVSAEKRSVVQLTSPTATPPLGGLAWQLRLEARHNGRQGGVMVQGAGTRLGVYAVPTNAPRGAFHRFHVEVVSAGGGGGGGARVAAGRLRCADAPDGADDFWGLGPMAPGGLDDAALVNRGLPTSGKLVLELRVTQPGAAVAADAGSADEGAPAGAPRRVLSRAPSESSSEGSGSFVKVAGAAT